MLCYKPNFAVSLPPDAFFLVLSATHHPNDFKRSVGLKIGFFVVLHCFCMVKWAFPDCFIQTENAQRANF
jgi:hypothetical protein